ncbi:Uncharacterized protein Adt_39390 [Abeliophyllum distichum]|uniref:DUF8040 domain-containing protein n=1 Tax=Abeliophyllum distichum TaxID=126358 RepID=A0ABD1Q5V8_9LAMI
MEERTEQEIEEEFDETIKLVLMALQAILQMLSGLMVIICGESIERPVRRSITTVGYDYIHKVLKEDPEHFRKMYRMYPNVFLKLCIIIREKTPLRDTRYICVEEMFATFLLTVGQNSQYCLTRKTFGRAHSTSSRNFNKILKALNTIASDMMVKPGSTVPSKYFLVDCGFANRRQFLAPFQGVRYHLQDFGGQGRNPENANEVFNLRHVSLRNVIVRIFGIFKSRFTIFKSAAPYPFRTQAEPVLVWARLHNFLRKECRSDEFSVEPNNEDSSPSLAGFEEDDDIFETQEHTNEWRANIASEMWRDNMNDVNEE